MKSRTIMSLGNAKQVNEEKVQKIIYGLSKLTGRLRIIDSKVDDPEVQIHKSMNMGIPLVINHFWEKLNMSSALQSIKKQYPKVEFDLELVFKSAIIYRLVQPGSERGMLDWFQDVYLPGVEKLQLQHLYRGLAIISKHQTAIENHLLKQSKTLFGIDCSIIFFDTTTTYFEGDSIDNEALKQYGHSKDHRPDRKQIKVGIVMSRDGIPIHAPIFSGDEADVTTVPVIIENLRKKAKIERAVFVGDSGMMSRNNIEKLKENKIQYILGARMRSSKIIKDEILPHVDALKNEKKNQKYRIKQNLFALEKKINKQRYIICFNPEEAKKDKFVRDQIIAELEASLTVSVKKYVKHRLKKRFLKIEDAKTSIDLEKVKQEEKYDGIFVIETDTDLSVEEVALRYKDLILVEQAFRQLKSTLDVRPIYHQCSENIKGHIFISFMALYFFCLLLKKLDQQTELPCEQGQLINSLSRIFAHQVSIYDDKFTLCSEMNSTNNAILKSVGINAPNRVLKKGWL